MINHVWNRDYIAKSFFNFVNSNKFNYTLFLLECQVFLLFNLIFIYIEDIISTALSQVIDLNNYENLEIFSNEFVFDK